MPVLYILGDARYNLGVSPTHPMHIEPDQDPYFQTTTGTFKENLTPEKGIYPQKSYI